MAENILIINSKENRDLLQKEDTCDKYDYLVAAGCGVIGGLIDIFLVGAPGNTVVGSWSDTQVDNVVMVFSRKMGWSPRVGNENNVKSAISYLERTYVVNYDQRSGVDVGNLFPMSTKNHHMKSLAHSPDIVGLFFSVLSQFTNTAAFVSGGNLITVSTDTYELQGSNFIAKIFCGVANWLGHLMSDVAGSSGASGRGSGLVMPFYTLFGFCNFGEFSVEKQRQDLATIAERAFTKGYDFRFGLAQAIPVVITDLSIRLIWAFRRYFQYRMPIKDCVPTSQHVTLRVMLLIGNGTLCVMDGIDAGIRSGGNALVFFMRLNLIAWFRFVMLVLKEVCIRIGIKGSIQRSIEAYKRINEALLEYLHELEKVDIVLFKEEVGRYQKVMSAFERVSSEEELNVMLLENYAELGFELPWKGDFDEFMSNKNNALVFE